MTYRRQDGVYWGAFESARPELAALGLDLLTKHGMCYLGTTSARGEPRITPVSVVRADSGLYVSLIPSTPKCRDLLVRPAFHLHALPGPGRVEFSVRGNARVVDGPDRVRLVAAHHAANVVIEDRDRVFELLVRTAAQVSHRWVDGGLKSEVDRWQADSTSTPEGGDRT